MATNFAVIGHRCLRAIIFICVALLILGAKRFLFFPVNVQSLDVSRVKVEGEHVSFILTQKDSGYHLFDCKTRVKNECLEVSFTGTILPFGRMDYTDGKFSILTKEEFGQIALVSDGQKILIWEEA